MADEYSLPTGQAGYGTRTPKITVRTTMTFFNILNSIEQAIYEIALWFILIPKTFFKSLVYPGRVQQYVKEELLKEEKEQFSDLMSPIIFWLLLFVVPAYMMIKHFSAGAAAFIGAKPENYILFVTMTLVSFLITPIFLMHAFEKKKINRESFKEAFYIQCYLQTPIGFVIMICVGIMKTIKYNFDALQQDGYTPLFNTINGAKDWLLIPLCLSFCYLAFVEVKMMRQQGRSLSQAILIIILSLLGVGFVMLVTGWIGYILSYGDNIPLT